MKAPISWLNDYVDVNNIKIKDFTDTMTMSGSKVEGYEELGENIKNVVIGKILKIGKHENADRLSVCQIDVGKDEPIQICTAATNINENDFIPVALDGAHLPTGTIIKKSKMRGVESNGMLCSIAELDLTKEDYPNADEHGIFILEKEYPLGQDIKEALGLKDYIVEFEITSNRPDCLCMTGIAREAAATFDASLTMPSTQYNSDKNDDISNYIKASVLNPALCPRYMLKVVKDVKIQPSPEFIRKRLKAAGVRPINNIVDITNYVMLEVGIPMHAFDHSLIGGHEIIVRNAKSNEKIKTLDEIDRTLSGDMLVICDKEKPVAVAGIMGGEFSGINDNTKTIVFEAANFNGPNIRISSKKLGLRSESSSRFEKGLDPVLCKTAIDRACALIELTGSGTIVNGEIDINNSSNNQTKIKLRPDNINKFLGTDVPKQQMIDILTKLEFKIENDFILPPSFRSDIEHEADISEEIARIYGYNNIASTIFCGAATQGMLTPVQQFEKKVVNTLLSYSMFEIYTYSFVSPKVFDMLNLDKDSTLRDCIRISNPLGEDTSVMRTTTIHSMLDALARNYNYKNFETSLFEIANIYIKNQDSSKLPHEIKKITLGIIGEKDFFDLKGIIEGLFNNINFSGYDIHPKTDDPTFHPGRCGVYTSENKEFAILGEIHPKVALNYGIEDKVYCAIIDFETIFNYSKKEIIYTPLPKFPAITRDLALITDKEMLSGTIEKCIKKYAGKSLEAITLFDVYEGKQVPEGQKSMAYSMTLRNKDKTLTDADADAIIGKIIKGLDFDLKIQLRS